MMIREYPCAIVGDHLKVRMPPDAKPKVFYKKSSGVILCAAETLDPRAIDVDFSFLYVQAPSKTLNLPWICMLTAGKRHIYGPE